MRFLHAALVAILFVFAWPMQRAIPGPDTARMVDVALILAVDVSQSVTETEAKLQRDGYAAALTSPEVIKAIQGGAYGKIAIAYFEWSGVTEQRTIVPWTIVDSPLAAIAVAEKIQAAELRRTDMNTAIGAALRHAATMLTMVPVRPDRFVIDVSGDGYSNVGEAPEPIRDSLTAKGVTINGLPIEGYPGSASMTNYYRASVVGGPGHFVVTAKGHADFALAVKTKIALEIAGLGHGPVKYALVTE
jgi:hypothetical protein